jgi:hypothetical protein
MKRLIFLKINITQIPDNFSKSKFIAQEKVLKEQAIKQFRIDIKAIKQIKVIKDYLPEVQVLIEFEDDQYQTVYEALCKMSVVETIDNLIPKDGLDI